MATRRLTGDGTWTALDHYDDPLPDHTPADWRTPVEIHDTEPGSPVWVPVAWQQAHEPDRYRVLSCPRYRACTDVAIKQYWGSWGCHGCEHVPVGRAVLEPDPARVRACEYCGGPIPIARGNRAITCSLECAREHRLSSNARRQRERRACQNGRGVGE